jgi:hypothetical protein
LRLAGWGFSRLDANGACWLNGVVVLTSKEPLSMKVSIRALYGHSSEYAITLAQQLGEGYRAAMINGDPMVAHIDELRRLELAECHFAYLHRKAGRDGTPRIVAVPIN